MSIKLTILGQISSNQVKLQQSILVAIIADFLQHPFLCIDLSFPLLLNYIFHCFVNAVSFVKGLIQIDPLFRIVKEKEKQFIV